MAKKVEKLIPTTVFKTNKLSRTGHWVFLIGILVAVIAGFIAIPYLTIALVIGGLIVGLLNITAIEVQEFLIACIALLLVGTAGLGAIALVGAIVESILKNIVAFVTPAALIVALKSVWELAKTS